MPLYQTGPNSWTNRPPQSNPSRSALPMPMVISDIMEPTEQVDGKFYTSKREFRAVGRALGLTEVGTERPKPKKKRPDDRKARREAVHKAIARYKAGERPRRSS